MDKLRSLLDTMLNEDLVQIVLSDSSDREKAQRVKYRPVRLKGGLYFQETLYLGKQVFHKNLTAAEAAARIVDFMCGLFRQAQLEADGGGASVLVGKKGTMTVKERRSCRRTEPASGEKSLAAEKSQAAEEPQTAEKPSAAEQSQIAEKASAAEQSQTAEEPQTAEKASAAEQSQTAEEPQTAEKPSAAERSQTAEEPQTAEKASAAEQSQTAEEPQTAEKPSAAGKQSGAGDKVLNHNRVKQYILEEGRPVDFLVGLGVMTPEGRVVKARYDKFRQINRYLEFIRDVLDELPRDRTIRVIDFGCGKSYLTFAMYYYLHELKKLDIEVTGLDLKADVIERCTALAGRYGYDRLYFEKGDISTYDGECAADMVVSLHACDTATDYALEKAVRWGASVILAVPCCQHELNRQLRCPALKPLLKYGVIRERMAALLTDAVRAELLEEQGYHTQILEFIDMEHTPKNLLIRAVKRPGMRPKKKGDIGETLDFLGVSPTLARLFQEERGIQTAE